jgi:hypothetical protein
MKKKLIHVTDRIGLATETGSQELIDTDVTTQAGTDRHKNGTSPGNRVNSPRGGHPVRYRISDNASAENFFDRAEVKISLTEGRSPMSVNHKRSAASALNRRQTGSSATAALGV